MRLRALIKLLDDLDLGDIDDVEVLSGPSVDDAGTITGVWVTGDSPPKLVLAVPGRVKQLQHPEGMGC